MGALTRNKGFDRLIDAWAMVHRRHPMWRLHIYGEGRRETELLAQIRDLGLDGVVVLKGYSTDVRTRMAEASVLAASSRAEGFPMVILEGMTCGLPVVSFDAPHGPRQLVTDGVNGYLIRNGDIDGMSQALSSLISGPEKRVEMGAAAVRTALQYEQSKITQRWIRLMQRLARKKEPASQKDRP